LDIRRCGDLLCEVGSALQPALRLDVSVPQPSDLPARRRRPSVLFLCTGNSTRSQIAEALLEHRSGGTIRARSGGSHPKPLHPNTVRVMAERGVDISTRTSKHLSRFVQDRFDRVITLCDKVREICPEFGGAAAIAHWSMPDPAAEGSTDELSYPAFVRTAEEIESRMPYLIGELTLSAGKGKAR
jgi:protein-tyrosine-phosphatase